MCPRYGALNPTSRNIAKFICYLLIAILASRLKVRLPGITGTMSVNFLFILLGVLELSFAETLVLGTAAILVQCFYRDRPSAIQVTFNMCASAFSIAAAYGVYHLALCELQVRSHPLLLVLGRCYLLPREHRFDCCGDCAHRAQVAEARSGWSAISGRFPTTWWALASPA